MRLMLGIVGLMLAYLALATGLALQFDRRFFFNDALAAVFFVVILITLLATARGATRRG
jgi:uncharacterized membrane protein